MVKKITAKFIIEIAGKPVLNVNKAIDFVLKKLKDEKKNFKLVDEFVGEPELDEKTTLYAGFIEATVKFEDASKILGFIVDYTPTSIEVEDPEKIAMTANEMTVFLNEVSSTLLKTMGQLRSANAYIHHLHKKFNIDPKTGKEIK
jgi:hypothetical protein